ncbi:hypothetical protein NDU88_005717 [Pleurodeles waltl]|uniref:Uncharacterized protein n=1 Tax=Pleurodeles waltl TaxID=8319 RepID=A0AAV7UK13_PLEWA|nr:hypothetical protein NDU88_005717 [Pleurodeles waltl]
MKAEKEEAGKEENEATGEQAVSITKEQEENATEEGKGDGIQEQEENAAGKLEENRQAGEWKNEAVEEGPGGDYGRTSPTEEQRGSKKYDPEPSLVPEDMWPSQVRA